MAAQRRRLLRAALTLAALVMTAAAPAAHAEDLIALEGDPPVLLDGAREYGVVYVNTTLRLTGDTHIRAREVYIGPQTAFRPCHVPGSGDNACGNGRNLRIEATGPLRFAAGDINLRGGTVSPRAGGSLTLVGGSVTVSGAINTAGTFGGSGAVTVLAAGPVAIGGGITAYGAPVVVRAGDGASVNGDVLTRGDASVLPAGSAATASCS
jgi:hypothetical protein